VVRVHGGEPFTGPTQTFCVTLDCMEEPFEFAEVEPLEPWGEDFDDQYFDGVDLDEDALYLLAELNDEEWERF